MKRFPFYKQPDAKDCGPTCLKIIARYYGKSTSIVELRRLSETTREGSSLFALSDTAEKIGFHTLGTKLSAETLKEAVLPCILHWNNIHFVVLYKIKKSTYYISDPSYGLIKYSKQQFLDSWIGKNASDDDNDGIALLIEPTPKFKTYKADDEDLAYGFGFLFKYVFRYKKFITQLIIGLLAGSLLQLVVPLNELLLYLKDNYFFSDFNIL